MKKLRMIFFITLVGLFVVSCQHMNNSNNPNIDNASIMTTTENFDSASSNVVPAVNKYSEACDAYREFLLGQRSDDQGEPLYSKHNNSRIYSCEFTLADINFDGIPELHFSSTSYTIYSYCDGQVFKVDEFPRYTRLLNNHSIYTDYWDRNREMEASRTYVEFGENLEPSFFIYFSHNTTTGAYVISYDSDGGVIPVTEQEFENVTSPILSYCTDQRNYDMISWTNFGVWISENLDEYAYADEFLERSNYQQVP